MTLYTGIQEPPSLLSFPIYVNTSTTSFPRNCVQQLLTNGLSLLTLPNATACHDRPQGTAAATPIYCHLHILYSSDPHQSTDPRNHSTQSSNADALATTPSGASYSHLLLPLCQRSRSNPCFHRSPNTNFRPHHPTVLRATDHRPVSTLP